MRSRNPGYSAATARNMARRTARKEQARHWFDEGKDRSEIASLLGITRSSVNLYLRADVR